MILDGASIKETELGTRALRSLSNLPEDEHVRRREVDCPKFFERATGFGPYPGRDAVPYPEPGLRDEDIAL